MKQRDACSLPCGLTKRKPKQAARLLAGITNAETKGAGLGGPEHDWSSHGADSYGLIFIAYEEQEPAREELDNHEPTCHGWDDRTVNA